MGKILSIIIAIIFIGVGVFLVYGNFGAHVLVVDENDVDDEEVVDEVSDFDAPRTFSLQVEGEILADTTSSGANKTPEFLLQLYPNLSISDFSNIEATGGSYSVIDGELIFLADSKNNEKNPTAKIISDVGMETLLINIIARTGRVIDSQESLTELFVFLKDNQDDGDVVFGVDIEVASPVMNELVKSPLTVTGKAKGIFVDGMFDLVLVDDKNNLMATSTARATIEVSEEGLTPFSGTLTFKTASSTVGKLLLIKRVDQTSAPGAPFEVLVRFR